MIIRINIPDDKPRSEEEERLRKGITHEGGYRKRNLLGLLNYHSTGEGMEITPENETKPKN